MRCRWHWVLVFALLLTDVVWGEERGPELRKQLTGVEQALGRLETAMQTTRAQYGKLHGELAQTEKRIGDLANDLETLEKQLAVRQRGLQELQLSEKLQQEKLQHQRAELAGQVRTVYMIGRQDYLKILLNQEKPDVVGRVISYYDYFNRAYSRQIAATRDTLERLQTLETNIRQEQQEITALQQQLGDQKIRLESSLDERQGILRDLSKEWENQQIQITMLEEDKSHLQSLLRTVDEAFAQVASPPLLSEPFPKRRGKLGYPVTGAILNSYGASRGLGSLRWQGVLIGAKPGDPVQAIADGRVVFADWLRNYGQLLIVEHDQHYMTLYGQNRRLHKKTGDWVRMGEVIASVGDSGGQPQAALYFEIRHNGDPLNPMEWLSR